MKLTSPAFAHGGAMPTLYTCEGKNHNPPLSIADIPISTASLVLIMDDPDVPSSIRSDQMWDHWVVFNISPSLQHIEENSSPFGTPGKNTSGANRYEGPCPPDREHRYFFKLYALKKKLDLKAGAAKIEVERAMEGFILAKAELMGRYEKRKKP